MIFLIDLYSLGARLFKKYNPEKSESDVDDFELCMYIFPIKYILLNNFVSQLGIFNWFGNIEIVVFSFAEN